MIEHQQDKGSNVKKRLILTAFTASAFALTALGQGTFQNLDFEAARVVFVATDVYSFIATLNALPGWTAFSGTNQLSVVAFNPGGMVVEPVGLYGSDAPVVIGGSFSLGLEAGLREPDCPRSRRRQVAPVQRPGVWLFVVAAGRLPQWTKPVLHRPFQRSQLHVIWHRYFRVRRKVGNVDLFGTVAVH